MSTFAPEWAWEMLGTGADTDQRGIKRAYSRLLKLNRPEDDAAAFQAVHQAYQAALAYAAGQAEYAVPAGQPDHADHTDHGDSVAAAPASLIKPAPALQANVPKTLGLDDPQELAARLWQRFLAIPEHLINERMALLASDAALENFTARDAVELLALRQAADPTCPPRLRARLAAHFEWDKGMAHLARSEPALASMAAAQLAADSGLEQLQAMQAHDEAVAYLLAPTVPEGLGRTGDRGFHRAMRARVDSLRWQYPEVIEHRLVPEVFAWWEHYAATRRYFVQTGMTSFAAGVVLFFLVQWPLALSTAALGALFLACVGGTVGAVAWLTLRPPQAPLAAYARFRRDHLDAFLHQRRFDAGWQHGWLAGLAALSPLLALAHPGIALQSLVTAGLCACAAASVFAASAILPPARIWLALAIGAVLGFVMQRSDFDQFRYACYPFAICLTLLSMQSGAPLYAQLGLARRRRLHLRAGWLAALPLCCMAADMLALPVSAAAMLAMLVLVTGVILARAKFRAIITWPAIVAIKICAFSTTGRGTILSEQPPQIAFLAGLIILVVIFMFVNIFTDDTD